ncbi:serine hydrolase domain-containing protein [Heyndrickxia sp. NPDC080065]|uniref:serine hydrolase domain-containing protein n=1 Tax=Heyndrickxia sp. NPDC080065 TaxID=3390568 RepID=UPI003CFD3156
MSQILEVNSNELKQELLKLEKKLKKVKIEAFIINNGKDRFFEYLKNKKIQEKPTKVYSVTKTIISILIGILVDKGMIKDIHVPIYHFFPQLLQSSESRKKEISIYHLLTMTSGLGTGNFQGANNWIDFILKQPITEDPGTTFRYNSGDSHLLSAIINKVSGLPTAVFAEENLFHPLGFKNYIWVKDPQGIHGGGFSLSMNIEDMMKIGLLLLQDGKFANKQIVSSDWIKQAQAPYKSVNSSENGEYGYGYQIWTYKNNTIDNPIDFFYANGIYGQYIFVVPKLNIVAVAKSQLQSEKQSLPALYFQDFLRGLETLE